MAHGKGDEKMPLYEIVNAILLILAFGTLFTGRANWAIIGMLFFFLHLIPAYSTGKIAEAKGRSRWRWWFFCIFPDGLGWLFALFLAAIPETKWSKNWKTCPKCQNRVATKAVVCGYCQSRFN